jgi:hypothetical protein
MLFVTSSAIAEERVDTDFRCLSGGANESIHLEFRTYGDVFAKWTGAYVKYKNSTTPISLVFLRDEATMKPEGRPWEFTSTWVEVFEGKITGEYEIVSQGANIYGFTYKNYRNKKVVKFYQNDVAYDRDGCKWE